MSQSNTPTEPGLYWCKYGTNHEWDCIAVISGQAPFFNLSVASAHNLMVYNKSIHTGHWVFGPRIEPPEVDANIVNLTDSDCQP